MKKHEISSLVNEVSRIAAGTNVKGTLFSKSDIRIDGCFEGDLATDGKLVVGEGASLKGNFICVNADIWGKVEGEICAKECTTFKSVASFEGNLNTGKISIEMGAIFNGNCKIITGEEFTAYQSKMKKV